MLAKLIDFYRRAGLPERDFIIEQSQCPAITRSTAEILNHQSKGPET